jgi:cyclin G-associated kinase
VGSLTSHNPIGLQGLLRDSFASLIGQRVEIANVKLRVKKMHAEGRFAFVFMAQDPNTGVDYALKRLIAADENSNNIITQ